MKRVIDRYNVQFNHVEQIKKFILVNNEWTIDGGELTPTLKLKRKVIEEKMSKKLNLCIKIKHLDIVNTINLLLEYYQL